MVIVNIEQASFEEETNHDEVTLMVPSNGDATRLLRFADKFNQIFGTRIIKTIGSWKETLITFKRDKAITTVNMLDWLLKMHEVETAEVKEGKNHQPNQEVILVKLATL